MLIKEIELSNFRNLKQVKANLSSGSIALIGENAQGKSNFLEAIEYCSSGKSSRTAKDGELIGWGTNHLKLLITFSKEGVEQSVAVELKPPAAGKNLRGLEKRIKINGVEYGSFRKLSGHLVTVSFTSQDLNLLRGGPKFRRDWLDTVITRIKPTYHDITSSYHKVVTQRNRLLKEFAEKGRVTVADSDQLLAWDKQLCRFAAQIIKQRHNFMSALLPLASRHHHYISGLQETLAANYVFHTPESTAHESDEPPSPDELPATSMPLTDLQQAGETDIARLLFSQLKARRSEEIWRRQTLVGPHRDDLMLTLNDASALAFASQGQQRSLVISLKLAELELVAEHLQEPPVLLLDDVLAELDLRRQSFLMSAVPDNMQTILTTTHLSGIEPRWLEKASVLTVTAGAVSALRPAVEATTPP